MRFDWYGATISGGPDEVVGMLAGFGAVERSRGRYGYGQGVEVRQGADRVAEAFWGGVNGSEKVHVQVSGDPTPEVVSMLRAEWPAHGVSRADACRDYSHEGAWRRLSKLLISVARKHSIKTRTNGDWIDGIDGRTLTAGGKTSTVEVRVYEKGKQLGPLVADPHRVRAEVQVRPLGSSAKRAYAAAQPEQLWQASRWSSDMATRLGVDAFEAIAIRPAWSPSSEERMRFWIAQQYGEGLKRWGNDVGWSNLSTAIDELRDRGKRERRR